MNNSINSTITKRSYTIGELKKFTTQEIINQIKDFLQQELSIDDHSSGQIKAWKESIAFLKSVFTKETPHWEIMFEFPLPLSSGKRPDILLINGVNVFIIEIKNKNKYSLADINQIQGYCLDLTFYHTAAKNFHIIPILMLLKSKDLMLEEEGVKVIDKNKLKSILVEKHEEYLFVNSKSLYEGKYKPIPSITEYAKSIFENKKLLNIEIPEIQESKDLQNEILKIHDQLKKNKEKGIVFITGEAGTGKSAIGISTVYNLNGLYVTKNRQFQEHLSKELGSHANLKTSHNFISHYGKKSEKPEWDVAVFDEAQRFNSEYKMKEYFGINKSEQSSVIEIFSKKDWCLLVVLIGIDQEIGIDERSNFREWKYVLSNTNDNWKIYGSGQTINKFSSIDNSNLNHIDNLELTKSFRNLKATYYPSFVNSLLDFSGSFNQNEFLNLKEQYRDLKRDGFKIFITRKFDKAVEYCKNRFGNSNNSYCVLASSQSYLNYNLCNEENNNSFKCGYEYSASLDVNEYLKNNALDKKDNHYYSLTEYSSIGFEVEIPILVWGYDFLWYKGKWNYDFERKVKGGTIYRKNTYRVFLTRGRNGIVLFFPPSWEFDNTFNLFKNLGANII